MVFWCRRGWYGILIPSRRLSIWYSGAVEAGRYFDTIQETFHMVLGCRRGWYGILVPSRRLSIWYSGAIEAGMVFSYCPEDFPYAILVP
jgi:hypothetical protein